MAFKTVTDLYVRQWNQKARPMSRVEQGNVAIITKNYRVLIVILEGYSDNSRYQLYDGIYATNNGKYRRSVVSCIRTDDVCGRRWTGRSNAATRFPHHLQHVVAQRGRGPEPSVMHVAQIKGQAIKDNGLSPLTQTVMDDDGDEQKEMRYLQSPAGRIPQNPVDTDARRKTTRAGKAWGLQYQENVVVDQGGFIPSRGVAHASEPGIQSGCRAAGGSTSATDDQIQGKPDPGKRRQPARSLCGTSTGVFNSRIAWWWYPHDAPIVQLPEGYPQWVAGVLRVQTRPGQGQSAIGPLRKVRTVPGIECPEPVRNVETMDGVVESGSAGDAHDMLTLVRTRMGIW